MDQCLKIKDCYEGMGSDGEAEMLNRLYSNINTNSSLTVRNQHEITDEIYKAWDTNN